MKKILIGMSIVGIITLAGCSQKDSTKVNELEKTVSSLKKENQALKKENEDWKNFLKENANTSSNNSNDSKEVATYTNNQEASLGDNTKETIRLKVTKVSTAEQDFPSHMISMDEYDVSKMIAVTIDYTNVAYGEAFLPHAQYFQAYTTDGKSLERVNQQSGQDMVDEGRTGTTTIYFKTSTPSSEINKIEMDFVPYNEAVLQFDLDVSH